MGFGTGGKLLAASMSIRRPRTGCAFRPSLSISEGSSQRNDGLQSEICEIQTAGKLQASVARDPPGLKRKLAAGLAAISFSFASPQVLLVLKTCQSDKVPAVNICAFCWFRIAVVVASDHQC